MARPKNPEMTTWVCPKCGYTLRLISSVKDAPYHSVCTRQFKRADRLTEKEREAIRSEKGKGQRGKRNR